MRSLKLAIEELSVETFVAGKKPAAATGTVRGYESGDELVERPTGYLTCDSTCSTCPTGLANACCV